jgi:ABC-2 type transport system permease protein
LGARFPSLGQRNPARIASGFGGTLNLVASMVFVAVHMIGIALVGMRELNPVGVSEPTLASLTRQTWQIGGLLFFFSVAVASGALWTGARHFEKLEY